MKIKNVNCFIIQGFMRSVKIKCLENTGSTVCNNIIVIILVDAQALFTGAQNVDY